jgi:hypothetical protein
LAFAGLEQQEISMTDTKTPPNENDRAEQTKREPVDQPAQQSRTNTAAQPGERASPGRRPLFRS